MNSDKIDKHRALKVRRRNYSTSVLSNHLYEPDTNACFVSVYLDNLRKQKRKFHKFSRWLSVTEQRPLKSLTTLTRKFISLLFILLINTGFKSSDHAR